MVFISKSRGPLIGPSCKHPTRRPQHIMPHASSASATRSSSVQGGHRPHMLFEVGEAWRAGHPRAGQGGGDRREETALGSVAQQASLMRFRKAMDSARPPSPSQPPRTAAHAHMPETGITSGVQPAEPPHIHSFRSSESVGGRKWYRTRPEADWKRAETKHLGTFPYQKRFVHFGIFRNTSVTYLVAL